MLLPSCHRLYPTGIWPYNKKRQLPTPVSQHSNISKRTTSTSFLNMKAFFLKTKPYCHGICHLGFLVGKVFRNRFTPFTEYELKITKVRTVLARHQHCPETVWLKAATHWITWRIGPKQWIRYFVLCIICDILFSNSPWTNFKSLEWIATITSE